MARRNINTSFGFRRVTEAFNEIARARICTQTNNTNTSIINNASNHQQYYSSNASTTNSSSSPELSDLIESFIERSNEDYEQQQEENKDHETTSKDIHDYRTCRFNVPDTKEMLKDLLQCTPKEEEKYDDDDDDDDVVKVVMNTIRAETELACRVIGTTTTTTTTSPQGFKRGLVTRLRQRGFDSGLCKSHWDKMAGFPSGDYEYVDVIVAGTRYIVEVSLAGEFSVARPTNHYLTLLSEFPQIYVGKAEDLKKVVKLMCASAKESLKNRDMHLPPWRRNRYMEAKWFGFYKRITTTFDDSGEPLTGKCTEGIQACSPIIFNYHCGGEVTGKVGLRVGNLALAFHGGYDRNL